MKKTGRHALTVLACFCFFAAIAPTVFESGSSTAVSRKTIAYLRDYYFPKGQWLADLRTIKCAVEYLYESRNDADMNPAEVARNPQPHSVHPAGTNFPATAVENPA